LKRLFSEDELSRKARVAAAEAMVPQWKIAEKLGISPGLLCYWRRRGMTEDEYFKIMMAIKELKREAQA